MTAEKDYKKECGKLMRSLGVARKKIETLEAQLAEETAKGDAYQQMQDINMAMITAIVRKLGEVTVEQELINETLEKGIQTSVLFDDEAYAYVLSVKEETEE